MSDRKGIVRMDNSRTIRQHEAEDRARNFRKFDMAVFTPPTTVGEFSKMNYGQRVATCKYYPDLYNEFIRQERENTRNGFSKRK